MAILLLPSNATGTSVVILIRHADGVSHKGAQRARWRCRFQLRAPSWRGGPREQRRGVSTSLSLRWPWSEIATSIRSATPQRRSHRNPQTYLQAARWAVEADRLMIGKSNYRPAACNNQGRRCPAAASGSLAPASTVHRPTALLAIDTTRRKLVLFGAALYTIMAPALGGVLQGE